MRAWILVSAFASSMVACSSSEPEIRSTNKGGSAGAPATTSTGSGATGVGSGGSTTSGSGGSGGSTGGSGGSTAGSGGTGSFDAGSADVSEDAKPDIGFSWPETVPGLKCKPGRYQGTFTGTYASSAAVIPLPIPVAGDINLTLVQSAKGEVLEITDGKLSGLANLVFPFSADLVGKLDCKTSKLDPSTSLKNGNYIVLGASFSFEGPFLGDYDKPTAAFVNGTWDVKEPNPLYGGTGSWTANWVSFVDAGTSDAGTSDGGSNDAPPSDATSSDAPNDVDEAGQ